MIDAVIHFSLRNRLFVLTVAAVLLVWGGYEATQIPVDVFPDLNRPTVTVMTEAAGLAPEEVETLVTFPLESVLNGAAGVQRVRSASGVGLSIVWVEFEWGSDIYVDRQVVAERLQLARTRLPDGVEPIMTPISSIMGEIRLVGLRSKQGDAGPTTPVELRTIADWTLRQRLLGIPGVSQVTVLGGELKQYQVLTTPDRLAQYDVTLDELTRAIEQSNVVAGGGFLLSPTEEKLIRVIGRVTDPQDLMKTVVRSGRLGPVTVGMAADVRLSGPVRRGAGSVNGEPAVILSIQKQPGADTLKLDQAVTTALEQIKPSLPADVVIDEELFRQGRFIETAVGNVTEAVRDGAIWVVVLLFVFLWNFRTSFITLLAIPLSVVAAALVFRAFGASINTMTLGGVAVAVGELVDDAIVDVENAYRRLKENQKLARPAPALRVVYDASKEVRGSIVYATAVVVLSSVYTYDVYDRRITKTVDADGAGSGVAWTEKFVYDGSEIVLAFQDPDAGGAAPTTLSNRYLCGPAVDQILADEQLSGGPFQRTLWTLVDHLGTVRDVADDAGAAVNHLTYDSFGELLGQTTAAYSTRYFYTGQERDAETGLQLHWHRYYDPAAQRWISEDPIGFAAGDANVQRYVGNDVMVNVDLNGFAPPGVMVPYGVDSGRNDDIAPPKPNAGFTAHEGFATIKTYLGVTIRKVAGPDSYADRHYKRLNIGKDKSKERQLAHKYHEMTAFLVYHVRGFSEMGTSIKNGRNAVRRDGQRIAFESSGIHNLALMVEMAALAEHHPELLNDPAFVRERFDTMACRAKDDKNENLVWFEKDAKEMEQWIEEAHRGLHDGETKRFAVPPFEKDVKLWGKRILTIDLYLKAENSRISGGKAFIRLED